MKSKAPKATTQEETTQEETTPEAIAPQVPKLSAQDVETITAIVANAPCPGGIPQADARRALISRFLAANNVTPVAKAE